MARPIWTGTIAFGLVNIPVKLFSAISESSLDLDMLDKKDKSHIRYKRVNENTGKEVAWSNIVKGYKVDGNYVVLEDKDFEQASAEKTKRIEITSFIQEEEIDPIYYNTTYYLEPDAKDAKPYALLRSAMQKAGVVGMGTFVMRNKEQLCVIKVLERALVLSKLHFEEEIRPLDDYKFPAASLKLNPAELKMASALIDSMKGPFDISAYKNEYTAQLLKFIRNKAKGKKATPVKAKVKVPEEVSSLLEQLKASLSEGPSGPKAKKAAPRKKAPVTKRRRKTA
ncbi:non-homologous end joining protein Ku [Taibaiella koreensis]|uniref:non-homologous end joining protein Ku n=1 Tax=Taibaiella koreensis TaxID=1268548 RepID=UPI000E59AD58|nr:Ku protein [Taibaiella koreensis]